MADKDDAPRYSVETFADMARIPAEAVPRFLKELPHMLAISRPVAQIADLTGSKLTLAPVWIDDDKGQFTTSIEVDGEELLSVSGRIPQED